MTKASSGSIALVGVGLMGLAYAKVLIDLGVDFLALGRGKESAGKFYSETGVHPTTGPLVGQLDGLDTIPSTAIVAVNAMFLTEVAVTLMEHGVKRILLEKPAGLDAEELAALRAAGEEHDAEIRVGYNRRFMQSAIVARQIIEEDGGVSSLKFDFSEPSRRIAALNKPERELTTWFYGNSSHVVDLAFHFFGRPARLQSRTSGGLDWHPVAACFVGSAESSEGAMLSWHANWVGPGRWGLEIVTKERRLTLQPLEKLRVQSHDSFVELDIDLDNVQDLEFKPGIRKQVIRFLFQTGPDVLPSLEEHARMFPIYEIVRLGGSHP